MQKKVGVIYILTNPSFPNYVKIGYADNVKSRVAQLNSSECTPFGFRVYATYDVEDRLMDVKIHELIDQLNPNLRSIDNINGKKRVREFYAMTKEQAYSILEAIAILGGHKERLKLWDLSAKEKQDIEIAQEVEEEHIERLAPFSFSKCNILPGSKIMFVSRGNRGNQYSGKECVVIDDKTVEYNGEKYSLSALAAELLGSNHGAAGPRYFKYNGEWLNEIRAKKEGWQTISRMEDVWVIPCNPKYYDVIGAFNKLDVLEWKQTHNASVGDTIYIYVSGEYKAIMFKCEVVETNLIGNMSNEDYEFYKEMEKQPDAKYMKIKLIKKYSQETFKLAELKENGLTNVQGRSKATLQLAKYLEEKQQ